MANNAKNLLGISLTVFIFGLNLFLLANVAESATNISSSTSEHWAWNDFVGWIDFYNTQTINVKPQKLEGYASSSVGDISLECASARDGSVCPQSNYRVDNDGNGSLSGWAWNDQYGWFSFDCNNNGSCGQSNYRVYVDSSGNFQNYAWNDAIGWISFNCANGGSCGKANYKVVTSWLGSSGAVAMLDSSTYDTRSAQGAQLNSVFWRGNLPIGTAVRFQFAVSNASSGPWNFVGTDGTNNTYYSTGPDVSLGLDYTFFNNARYFRYRITLLSNQARTLSPRVDEVLINWSP